MIFSAIALGVAAVKNAEIFPEFCRLKLLNAHIKGFQ